MRAERIAVGVFAGLLVVYLAVVWLEGPSRGRRVRMPEADAVVGVTFPSGPDTLHLARTAGGWTVSRSGEAPVPAGQVLVDALLAGLAEAGPAPPTHRTEALGAIRRVVLTLDGGDTLEIDVGRRRPGGHGCPAEVDGARLDLPSTVDWLLDRPLEGWTRALATDLDLDAITRVEVRGAASLDVARAGDGWTVDGQAADPDRVRAWLSYLGHLPALGVAPWDPAPDASILEATVVLTDGPRETVALACPDALARTASGTWHVLDLVCTRLAATPADLVGAPLIRAEPTRIRLEREGGGWTLERRGSGWVLVEPEVPVDANAARLVAEYLADLAPPPVPVGPGPETFAPEVTLAVTTARGETHTIAFGTTRPDGLVPASVDGGAPQWLESYQVDPVLPLPEDLARRP